MNAVEYAFRTVTEGRAIGGRCVAVPTDRARPWLFAWTDLRAGRRAGFGNPPAAAAVMLTFSADQASAAAWPSSTPPAARGGLQEALQGAAEAVLAPRSSEPWERLESRLWRSSGPPPVSRAWAQRAGAGGAVLAGKTSIKTGINWNDIDAGGSGEEC